MLKTRAEILKHAEETLAKMEAFHAKTLASNRALEERSAASIEETKKIISELKALPLT